MIVSFQCLCTWRHTSKLPHRLNVIEGMMLSQQQWPTIIIEWLPCQQGYVWLAFIKAWLKLVNVFSLKIVFEKKDFVNHMFLCIVLFIVYICCIILGTVLLLNSFCLLTFLTPSLPAVSAQVHLVTFRWVADMALSFELLDTPTRASEEPAVRRMLTCG